MKNLSSNQKEELFHLNQLKQLCKDFPDGYCDFDDKLRRAELVVHTNNGNIGIEHTRLTDQPTKAQESLQNKIAIRAREVYERENVDLLQVNFIFNNHKPLRGKMVEPLALQIAHATKLLVAYLKATKQFQTIEYLESYKLRWHGITNFFSPELYDYNYQAILGVLTRCYKLS